jgi:hypothetical protein
VFYPFAKAREALALYRDFATSIPDEVNTVAALMNSPDGDPLAAIVLCYNGDLAIGEKILRPLRSFGPPVADQVAPTPYRKVQTFFDEAFIRGRRYYFKSNFTRSISDEAVATLVEQFATAPSPLSMLYFQQLGNAANRVGATETAFSHVSGEPGIGKSRLTAALSQRIESELHTRHPSAARQSVGRLAVTTTEQIFSLAWNPVKRRLRLLSRDLPDHL